MAVKVIHRLPAVGFAVYHKARAIFLAAVASCDFLRFEKQVPKQSSIFWLGFHEVGEMLFGNHQQMHGRLRIYIVKRQNLIIFVHLVRGHLAFYYFTKNAVTHKGHYITDDESRNVKEIKFWFSSRKETMI
jgi:hypothetical protein